MKDKTFLLKKKHLLLDISYMSRLYCQGGIYENGRVSSPENVSFPFTHRGEKQPTKFSSATFQKMLSSSYMILIIQSLEDKQCRSI